MNRYPQIRASLPFLFFTAGLLSNPQITSAVDELYNPKPLQKLKRVDHVVLAKCIKDEPVETGIQSLTFKVDKVIKPTKFPGSFKSTIMNNISVYPQVNHGKLVLLMIKQDDKGRFWIHHAFEDESVKGGLKSLVPIVEKYLKVTALKDKRYVDEMKAFIFDGLQHQDGTIVKRGAAFELADLFKSHPKLIKIDNKELEQLVSVVKLSKDSQVVFPICEALSQGGESASVDDACIHTIVEFDNKLHGWYELYPAVAKRKSLRSKLFDKALQEKDEVKLFRIIDHLMARPKEESVRDLAKVWKQNEAAHKAILFYLSRLRTEDRVKLRGLIGLLTEPLLRKWTHKTGDHKIEAKLVELYQGKVWLKKADDNIIKIPLNQLSKRDQEYVKKALPESFPKKPTPKTLAPK